jgi:Ca2+:H+ antiporter
MPVICHILREKGLLFGLGVLGFFSTAGASWLSPVSSLAQAGGLLAVLLAAMLACAFGVVRHADALAHRCGEPLGTLILTLSVTGMEVGMVSAVMLSGKSNPALARDTMFAVVMIVLGALLGVSLLLGAFRHKRQEFNLDGAGAFLSLIIPLAVFGMVIPNFTTTTAGPTFSHFQGLVLAVLCVATYALFLGVQTVWHRDFFARSGEDHSHTEEPGPPLSFSVLLLFACLVPVVLLAKKLALVLEYGTESLGMPHAVAGVVVAALILAPEGLSAVKAAWQNQLQRSVNLLLGCALATIALTIPSVLVVGLLNGREIHLGLPASEVAILGVMLAISLLTFSRGKTNVLQGAVHLLVFLFWLALVFEA